MDPKENVEDVGVETLEENDENTDAVDPKEDVEDAGVETLEENDENKTNKVGLRHDYKIYMIYDLMI